MRWRRALADYPYMHTRRYMSCLPRLKPYMDLDPQLARYGGLTIRRSSEATAW